MSVVVKAVIGWPSPADLLSALNGARGIFFLDSAWPSRTNAMYSFIGFNPFLTVRASPDGVAVENFREPCEVTKQAGPPTLILDVLREQLKRFRSAPHPEIPFTGGAVGYFSYELGAAWEKVKPREKLETGETPEVGESLWAEFSFYDGLLAFAHRTSQWFCVANSCGGRDATAIVDELTRVVSHALQMNGPATPIRPTFGHGTVETTSTREAYIKAVSAVKEYIAAGDVYQVNIAHVFSGKWQGGGPALYARLRSQTPAPFGAFLMRHDGYLLSSSPESFLRLRGDVLETRPIKGTRARGGSFDDERQITELTSSAKERAELLMIVDLERNDLARVCRPGSIEVSELYGVETHPTVFHLVATVRGKLLPAKDVFDAVRVMFPGGSITGAPKIRAMQIIRELESVARGPYTGAIGYFGFDGSADLNIAIRTIVLKGEDVSYHVGAGIVWDSHPESEYEETLAKGRALRTAIESGGASDNPHLGQTFAEDADVNDGGEPALKIKEDRR